MPNKWVEAEVAFAIGPSKIWHVYKDDNFDACLDFHYSRDPEGDDTFDIRDLAKEISHALPDIDLPELDLNDRATHAVLMAIADWQGRLF